MIKNGEIYTNIMEKLHFEPNIDASNITIAVKDQGLIVLGGKVKSYAEKRLAEDAVKTIEKVKGVANELEVDLLASYQRSDVDILKTALHILEWTLFVPHCDIKVTVENGHLTLTGEAEYNYQKEDAQKAIHNLYGVTYVTNNIQVKPNVTPTEVKNQIIKEFERNARIEANNIQVEIIGSSIILKGKVKNFDEDREARNAAWSIPGVTDVIDQLVISDW